MTNELIVQYLGFRANLSAREYSFAVREPASESLQYTVSINNDAFTAHRARYQDAPEICSLRLRRELAEHANHPPTSEFCVTDAELADYVSAHQPKPRPKMAGFSKPQ